MIILLLKDFTLLIAGAFIIAAPLGWYVMNRWLQGFAFRIDVELWMVIVAGFVALIVAVATISFQSMKVAKENPVKSLRSE